MMDQPTQVSPNRFDFEFRGNAVLIFLSGRVGAVPLTQVQKPYNAATRFLQERPNPGLVIDCEGLESISSMPLGSIMKLASVVKRRRGQVAFSRLKNVVAQYAFSCINLLDPKEVPAFDELEDAIDAVAAG
ncbi:MAG: STAS domain-containing protein [Planctomycetota bacterium]|jgi:hypothetical protein